MATFLARDEIHQCRVLAAKSGRQKLMERMEDKARRLEQRQPQKVGGRHMLFKENVANSRKHGVKQTTVERNDIMKDHGKVWKTLPPRQRDRYNKEGKDWARSRKRSLEEMAAGCRIQADELSRKQPQKIYDHLNHLQAVRFDEADLEELATMMQRPEYGVENVKEWWEEKFEAPDVPTEVFQERFIDAAEPFKETLDNKYWWCPIICSNAAMFDNVALVVASNPGVAYFILRISKNPYTFECMQMECRSDTPRRFVLPPQCRSPFYQ